jgi:azurin
MFIQKRLLFLLLTSFFMTQAKAHSSNDTTISINAVGGLQYDLVRFKVKPGVKVKIIFTNKDDMSHNLVITQPGARLKVVNAAIALGNDGAKMNYIPKLPEVLWSVPILSPGETKTITFIAPKKEGVYPYVCTYPGHGFVMFGAMYVTDQAMPAMKNDPNIPPERKKDAKGNSAHQDHSTERAHSYREVPPCLYRIFLPDASPAAIAVNLPHNVSYCWDAGECRLRFAWQGDFLDNTNIWKGHHDAYGSIMGTIFYRDKTAFPLQPDQPGNIPTVDFKGYQLINRYPEFHYTIDGIEVYELIKPKEDGTGLIRTFRIPKTSRMIWFVFDPEDGVSYQSSAGKWINNKLKLLPDEAWQFTITMTKK